MGPVAGIVEERSQCIVDGTKPGPPERKGRNTTTETTERLTPLDGGGDLGTPSSFRFTVSATTTMYVHGIAERPRAPRHPEARAQGGTVEPRLASAFFSPATRPTAMSNDESLNQNDAYNQKRIPFMNEAGIKSHPPSLFLSLHLRRYSALPLTLSIDKARPSRPEDRSLAT